jgi:hypothetical protein
MSADSHTHSSDSSSVVVGYTNRSLQVYAFGVVLWELLTRGTPYGGMSLAAIAVGVLRDDLRPSPLDEIPTAQRFEPLEAIMVECWDRDPAMRPSFHEVMTRIAAISPKTDDAAVPLQLPSISSEPSLSSSHYSWGLDSLAAPATDVNVTVAFSDVADAACPWESNPRDMRGAMEHHNQLLRKLLAAHHGYESRFMQQQQQQQQHLDNGEGYFCMVFADPTNALQWHPRRLLKMITCYDLAHACGINTGARLRLISCTPLCGPGRRLAMRRLACGSASTRAAPPATGTLCPVVRGTMERLSMWPWSSRSTPRAARCSCPTPS